MGLPDIFQANQKKAAEAFLETVELSGLNQMGELMDLAKTGIIKDGVRLYLEVWNHHGNYVFDDNKSPQFVDFLYKSINILKTFSEMKDKRADSSYQFTKEDYTKINDVSALLDQMDISSMRDAIASVMNTVDRRTLAPDDSLMILSQTAEKMATFKSFWGLKQYEKSYEILKAEMDEYSEAKDTYKSSCDFINELMAHTPYNVPTIGNVYKSNVAELNQALDQLDSDADQITYEQIEEVREELFNIDGEIQLLNQIPEANPVVLYDKFTSSVKSNTPDNPFYVSTELKNKSDEYSNLSESITKIQKEAKILEKKQETLNKKKYALNNNIREKEEEYQSARVANLHEETTSESLERSDKLREELEKLKKEDKQITTEYDILAESGRKMKTELSSLKKKRNETEAELNTLKAAYHEGLKEKLNEYGYTLEDSEGSSLKASDIKNIKSKVSDGLKEKAAAVKKSPFYNEEHFKNPELAIENLKHRAKEIKNGKIYKQSTLLHKIDKATESLNESKTLLEKYNKVAVVGKKINQTLDSVKLHTQEQINAGMKDFTDNVTDQLKSILKRMNDKKSLFHKDTKEFTAMTNSLNRLNAPFADIMNGDSPEKAEAFLALANEEDVTKIIKEIRDNTQKYVDAKMAQKRNSPSEMRLVRLNGAKEILSVCNTFLTMKEKVNQQIEEVAKFNNKHLFDESVSIHDSIELPKAKEVKDGFIKEFNCNPELAPEAVRDARQLAELEKNVASRRELMNEGPKMRKLQEKKLAEEEKQLKALKEKMGKKSPEEKEQKVSKTASKDKKEKESTQKAKVANFGSK